MRVRGACDKPFWLYKRLNNGTEREENETATETTNLVKEVEQLKVLLKEKEERIALLLSTAGTGTEDASVQ